MASRPSAHSDEARCASEWTRGEQITADDFKISTTIAGVNMRLGPGGVRELHWHQQAEWAVMTHGECRA
jgi:oxalate decarboxylase